MIKGILKIAIITFVLIALHQLILYYQLPWPVSENAFSIIFFYFFQSVTVHALFHAGRKHLDIGVPMLVMATMTIRMLTALAAAVIFIMLGVANTTDFVITFFAVYLLYFVFEITSVLSNLRTNLK
ncbi:MAG: hypothetical protein JXQ96_00565 [Cyclobacteriaceae bacterium]